MRTLVHKPTSVRKTLHGDRSKAHKRGFTLIELLVVVAIIALLAAIAMAQFAVAQVRAKLARAQGDFKALQLGVNMYYLDNERLPPNGAYNELNPGYLDHSTRVALAVLSTPVTYVSSVPYEDPFNQNRKQSGTDGGYVEVTLPGGKIHKLTMHYQWWHGDNGATGTDWVIYAMGPSQRWPGFNYGGDDKNGARAPKHQYDPTNGLKSLGVLWVVTDQVFETGKSR